MKAYVVSLGCPKNLTDSEVIMGDFVSSGYDITTNPNEADTIIINTCAFLKSARDEAKEVIEEMSRFKKNGNCKKILLAGCLPKWNQNFNSKKPIENVDEVIDSVNLYNSFAPRIKATSPWYAYVKIAEGCSNNCSYCLVPMLRGGLKIRDVTDIIKEVKSLAKKGVKEIIFVAQDTSAHPQLADLLKKAAQIAGISWIRLMYVHPEHLNDEIIKVIASEKNIVKYLDLPIQHCSDKILKLMNRCYNKKDLENIILKIRKKIPNITLRTSIIVGFPGETNNDFNELLEFINFIEFDKLGVFIYQKEKGTLANTMKNQIPQKIKKTRFNKLMRAQISISKKINRGFIGKTIEALIEGEKNGSYFGRTFRDAPDIDGKIFIKKTGLLIPGETVKAKITAAKIYDLIGEATHLSSRT